MNSKSLAIVFSLAIVIGCGGGGGSSTAPAAKGGQAVLTVKWPARVARAIPAAANSLAVTVLQGSQIVATVLVARPAGGAAATTTTTHLSELPFGDLDLQVAAFPNADGSGVAQAKGAGTITVSAAAPGKATVALGSTVTKLVLPAAPVVGIGDTAPISVSAQDADGNVVLLAAGGGAEAIAWSVADPDVATIGGAGPTATLTGVAAGTTTVAATFQRDDGAKLKATAPLSALVQSLALSADSMVTYGASGPTWGSVQYGGTSALPRVTVQGTLSPTRSTASSVSLALSGPLADSSAGTATAVLSIPANASSGTTTLTPQHVDVDTPATVTGTLGALNAAATVTVKPNPLVSVSGPASLASGAAGTGTVSLGLYALVAETLTLACDDPTVTLPASVTVAGPVYHPGRPGGGSGGGVTSGGQSGGQGGQGSPPYFSAVKTVSFVFTAPAVTAPRTVTITATRAGVSKSFAVTINP